jgi:hypothetical protein
MAATAPKISANGELPSWLAAPVFCGAPPPVVVALLPVVCAPVAVSLSVALETVELPLDVLVDTEAEVVIEDLPDAEDAEDAEADAEEERDALAEVGVAEAVDPVRVISPVKLSSVPSRIWSA